MIPYAKQHAERQAARKAARKKDEAMLEVAMKKLEVAEENKRLNGRPMKRSFSDIRLLSKTVDKHVLAKKIELPTSQSNDEDLSLDEPTSKEEITLSINDEITKEPEVEAVEIMDNHSISKIDGANQELEFEDRTK
ncbi:hypothetical protein ACLB2K_031495 [Fragaria x ananassa]